MAKCIRSASRNVRIGHPTLDRLSTARHGVNSIAGFGVPNNRGIVTKLPKSCKNFTFDRAKIALIFQTFDQIVRQSKREARTDPPGSGAGLKSVNGIPPISARRSNLRHRYWR